MKAKFYGKKPKYVCKQKKPTYGSSASLKNNTWNWAYVLNLAIGIKCPYSCHIFFYLFLLLNFSTEHAWYRIEYIHNKVFLLPPHIVEIVDVEFDENCVECLRVRELEHEQAATPSSSSHQEKQWKLKQMTTNVRKLDSDGLKLTISGSLYHIVFAYSTA